MKLIKDVYQKIKAFIAKTKVGSLLVSSIKQLIESDEVGTAVITDTKEIINDAVDKALACTPIDVDVDITIEGVEWIRI